MSSGRCGSLVVGTFGHSEASEAASFANMSEISTHGFEKKGRACATVGFFYLLVPLLDETQLSSSSETLK